MAELPILFSGPMVRAILEGRKTVTRRVVTQATALEWLAPGMFTPAFVADPDNGLAPYQPGDTLWVRERMRVIGRGPVTRRADQIRVRYEADGTESAILPYPERLKGDPKIGKCLAYGGYREAARLFLRVTEVRVERLQVISGVDAVAEGCGAGLADYELLHYGGYKKARQEFRRLWDSLNAKRGFGWDSNPWVWVYRFERVEAPHG